MRDFLLTLEKRLQGASCPFTVHVAGQVKDMIERLADKDQQPFRRPWIQLHGFVPDIKDFYSRVDLIVSPVMVGTGMNIKTVQAMAYGMPLLTTQCGIKGIDTPEPLHHHPDVPQLVESLLSLQNKPEELNRLADAGRESYLRLYEKGINAMRNLFGHPKLVDLSTCKKEEDIFWYPGLLDYQKHALSTLMHMAAIRSDSIKNMNVIEVGGSGNLALAKTLFGWSGRKVLVVTPDPELHPGSLEEDKLEIVLRGIENSGLPDYQFDLIIGIAILEHVRDYPGMFHECFRLLKPGGYLLLHGGPLWFSSHGHHLFIARDDMDYRFIGNNPVPDWGHLIFSSMEMDNELSSQGIPPAHREAIRHGIYNSETINRASLFRYSGNRKRFPLEIF